MSLADLARSARTHAAALLAVFLTPDYALELYDGAPPWAPEAAPAAPPSKPPSSPAVTASPAEPYGPRASAHGELVIMSVPCEHTPGERLAFYLSCASPEEARAVADRAVSDLERLARSHSPWESLEASRLYVRAARRFAHLRRGNRCHA